MKIFTQLLVTDGAIFFNRQMRIVGDPSDAYGVCEKGIRAVTAAQARSSNDHEGQQRTVIPRSSPACCLLNASAGLSGKRTSSGVLCRGFLGYALAGGGSGLH